MTPQEETETYFDGFHNLLIRSYYYLEQGLTILNNFRNLFLGIIGIYVALKFTNPLWMILMFVPSVMFLCLIGWYNVHKLAKVKEWLGVRFSTYYGIKQFNYSAKTAELLEEIRDLLKNDK